jgi:hemoglobin
MNLHNDINSVDDIKLLVNDFYEKVRQNPLIGPIFNNIVQDRWPQHLETMYKFWQTVLLGEQTYFGGPFPKHARLPVTQEHFDTWLKLWYQTVDDHFQGEKATEAKWRADKMAAIFVSKIEYYRNNSGTPII